MHIYIRVYAHVCVGVGDTNTFVLIHTEAKGQFEYLPLALFISL